jgi:hypothetical protein
VSVANFWKSQADFWTSSPSAQRKAAKLGVRPVVGELPGWRSSASVPSAPSPSGDTIRVDGDAVEQWCQRMIDAVGPAVESAMANGLGQVMQSGVDAWPVKSGLSRALAGITFKGEGSEFVARLFNRAPYVWMIPGQPWRSLIERPAREAVRQIGFDATRAVAGGTNGG